MKEYIIKLIILASIVNLNLHANNFDLALDIARYNNIERTVKNENAIIQYINQYIIETGDIAGISRKNIALEYNLAENNNLFKNYNNELIEIHFNPTNEQIEIYNLIPANLDYREMYINSLNRENKIYFDTKIKFDLNVKENKILNIQKKISKNNFDILINFSNKEPNDKNLNWFKPNNDGSVSYYKYSILSNSWENLGLIGAGEVLQVGSEIDINTLTIFDGQEIAIIDSNNEVRTKYFNGSVWKDLDNAMLILDTTVLDTNNTFESFGSLIVNDNVNYNIYVGDQSSFLRGFNTYKFDNFDVGSTISVDIYFPEDRNRIAFNFIKVSNNIFRSTSFYNNKLILLVKDISKLEDVPYNGSYVLYGDNQAADKKYIIPINQELLFYNHILLDNKYYYCFDSVLSFESFSDSLQAINGADNYNYLEDVVIQNKEGKYIYYKIGINDNNKFYLYTDLTREENSNEEKIMLTYSDINSFPIAKSNIFKYLAAIGTGLEKEIVSNGVISDTFHSFEYLEGYDFLNINRNLAEVPSISSGKEAYIYLSTYTSQKNPFLKDIVNNKYIHINSQNKEHIIDKDNMVLLSNADEMLYVHLENLNDWYFNKAKKFDISKNAIVDAEGITYGEFKFLVINDSKYYYKYFYNKDIFEINQNIFLAKLSVVNSIDRDSYCLVDWRLTTNNEINNINVINKIDPIGYRMTSPYLTLTNDGYYGIGERHYWVSDIKTTSTELNTYFKGKYEDVYDPYKREMLYGIVCINNNTWNEVKQTSEYYRNINSL